MIDQRSNLCPSLCIKTFPIRSADIKAEPIRKETHSPEKKKTPATSRPGVVKGSGGDGLGELGEIDPPVAVGVGLSDHPGELLDGERMAELGHGVGELGRGDVPVPIPVEQPEQPP